MRPTLLLLVLTFLAAASPAAARSVPGSGFVTATQFHEVNVVVEVAGPLAWEWRAAPAGAQAYFDIHRHEADGTFTKVREVASGASHAASVQVAPGLYSYYWSYIEGSPTPTQVSYTMSGQFRFEDEPPGTGRDAPVASGNASPVPVALALVALLGVALLRPR